MARRRSVAACVLVGALAALAGGCASNDQLQAIQNDPSPAERTETERTDDMTNQMAHTRDTNMRLLGSDLGRLFLLDRPSRLTPTPMR
jgi:hypothetical protein